LFSNKFLYYRSDSKTFPDAFTNIIDTNQKLLGQQEAANVNSDSSKNEHNRKFL